MRQAAAARIFLRNYSSNTCPGTVKSHAFDGRCSIRFGAVVRMSKQRGGRTCNKDGQPEAGAVSLLDGRSLCRDRADAVAGKRAPTRLGRSSQSCGSELAREGAGTAGTSAGTEPTPSRASAFLQLNRAYSGMLKVKVVPCSSVEFTSMRPSWARAIWLAIYNPSPNPAWGLSVAGRE